MEWCLKTPVSLTLLNSVNSLFRLTSKKSAKLYIIVPSLELTIPVSWASERVCGREADGFLDMRSHCFRGVRERSIQEARMAQDSLLKCFVRGILWWPVLQRESIGGWCPSQRSSNVEGLSMSWLHHDKKLHDECFAINADVCNFLLVNLMLSAFSIRRSTWLRSISPETRNLLWVPYKILFPQSNFLLAPLKIYLQWWAGKCWPFMCSIFQWKQKKYIVTFHVIPPQ